jgi:membrane protease subunit HflK
VAASGDDNLNTDQKIRRSAARTLFNSLIVIISLGVMGAWGSTGLYYTEPGESTVVLVLGRYHETVENDGWNWRLPAPLGGHQTLNVNEMRRMEFGFDDDDRAKMDLDVVQVQENEVQTSDSNIVIPRYVVQYRVKNLFTYLYSLKDPRQTLRDASQSAMREVIGRHGIDEVLASNRLAIEIGAKEILEEILTRYARLEGDESAFDIRSIQLQSSQPPAQVQDAFDDVVAAKQDKDRVVSVAQGDAREIRERADAKSVELVESANGFKGAKVLKATGEAARFELLLAEYSSAKDVTRQRLYFETMEEIMGDIEKVVVDPGTAQVLPMLSFPNRRVEAPAPVGAATSAKGGQ